MDLLSHLRTILRDGREDAGATQPAVATIAGVHPSNVSRFEGGRTTLNLDELVDAYAQVIGCDPADLWRMAVEAAAHA